MPELNVSYKPQKISPKFEVGDGAPRDCACVAVCALCIAHTCAVQGSVAQLLASKIPTAFMLAQFQSDVMKPLKIEEIQDQLVLPLPPYCLGIVRP